MLLQITELLSFEGQNSIKKPIPVQLFGSFFEGIQLIILTLSTIHKVPNSLCNLPHR